MFSLPKIFSRPQPNGKKKAPASAPARRVVLQNPHILEVNLIKDEAVISFDWNKNLMVLVLVLALAGLVVMEVYFGLGWWADQETARLTANKALVDQANAATAQLKNQTAAALAYKAKSADFSLLLANHVVWDNFFSWLERNTLSTVQYDSFSGGLDGNYTLNATAVSYADAAWQVKAFLADPLTKAASVTEVTGGQSKDPTKAGRVSFSLSLQVDPGIFKTP